MKAKTETVLFDYIAPAVMLFIVTICIVAIIVFLAIGINNWAHGSEPAYTPKTQQVVPDSEYSTGWVNTVDGRRIPCVWTHNTLSCDWSAK